jgi:hypothetical protein
MRGTTNVLYLLALTAVWVLFFSSNSACAPIMVDKNLFASDRKPPSPESAAPAPQTNKGGLSAKAVQLDGIFMQGDTKKAIVRVKGQMPGSKSQNPYITVGEGEKLADLLVVKIDSRSISLERDGQTEVVKLFGDGKIVVPPPPVPTSPAPTPPQQGMAPPAADAAGAQGQPGVHPPQPPTPQATGNIPVLQRPRAGGPPGGRQAVAPPGQNQPDESGAPSDEGDLEGEAEEPSS